MYVERLCFFFSPGLWPWTTGFGAERAEPRPSGSAHPASASKPSQSNGTDYCRSDIRRVRKKPHINITIVTIRFRPQLCHLLVDRHRRRCRRRMRHRLSYFSPSSIICVIVYSFSSSAFVSRRHLLVDRHRRRCRCRMRHRSSCFSPRLRFRPQLSYLVIASSIAIAAVVIVVVVRCRCRPVTTFVVFILTLAIICSMWFYNFIAFITLLPFVL